MKNLILLFAFTLSLGFANAQGGTQTPAPAKTETTKAAPAKAMPAKPAETAKTMPAKTDAPKTMDKAADKKMADMNTKEHVCTAACKDGKHVYAHGEKGHTCTAACHKSMAKGKKAKKMTTTAPAAPANH